MQFSNGEMSHYLMNCQQKTIKTCILESIFINDPFPTGGLATLQHIRTLIQTDIGRSRQLMSVNVGMVRDNTKYKKCELALDTDDKDLINRY